MQSPHISVVVTAPRGIESCHYLDDWVNKADCADIEIVVVDGAQHFVDQSRTGLKHVSFPGRGPLGLLTEGVLLAVGEWVLVTEDHCRPLPGIIERYREAVSAFPEVDIFAGAVDNLTSTSPWSAAVYVSGIGEFSPHVNHQPRSATNANLLVRRSAIYSHELAVDGGLLMVAIPRLFQLGRFKYWASAVVDHVVHLDALKGIAFAAHCGLDWASERRKVFPRRSRLRAVRDGFAILVWCAMLRPREIAQRFRGAWQPGFGSTIRALTIGVTTGLVLILFNFRDLFRHADSTF